MTRAYLAFNIARRCCNAFFLVPGENVLFIPSQIGRFEVLSFLGEGGFGKDFLARDPQSERLVAITIPRIEVLCNRQWHERFLREARAVAELEHPHIVPVLESGEIGPICYIARSIVKGGEEFNKLNSPELPAYASTAPRLLVS